jgi:hypothetical protein
MLKTISGRDLLLHIGSASADVLYYELTGIARLWNRVWHDMERAPLWSPAIEHPLGSIETRVNAAYIATETNYRTKSADQNMSFRAFRPDGRAQIGSNSVWWHADGDRFDGRRPVRKRGRVAASGPL